MTTILMSPPDYFSVDYAINPWMEVGAVNLDLAKKQWDNLVELIEKKAGGTVEVLPAVEGLPDLVFTANAAFIHDKKAIIARYKHPERQGEEPYCTAWFSQKGYEVITLPEEMFFEGAGDALKWKDRVFAGYKTRTAIVSHHRLSQETGLPVLSLELIDERFYHIDVCICPLDTGDFIYYPEAFDHYGKQVIEANIPEKNRIAVSAKEAEQFACNSISIGETVIFNEGSIQLAETLKTRGLNVLQVDLSEFIKAGGSAKCLTLKI
jgi:N-dimethylarginine dimethylaminohydrolase